ncbi:O-succinylbenzoate-CoA ligase [Desulfatibacillum aliphaticivorans]|uniref:O-succinylbenzoate-CoA ligase n=1 Tax=Desulfatibacillum aliphaticivorans TaxID=218208 RepID=B8FA13_DESAL|nr:AMP-binding protein [Desulfatibacillum aliphaticivorans]ACL03109.1 O-succinylbenzoate-CoA ligase [Desulfatibacillum aliphaticivorans]
MPPFIDHNNRLDLEALLDAYGGAPALISKSQTLSFNVVKSGLQGVVSNLRTLGVRPGQLLCIHAPNSLDHIFLFLASWVMGFTYAALDPKAPAGKVPAGLQPDFLITPGDPAPWPCRMISPHDLHAPAPAASTPLSAIPLDRECSVIFTSGSTGAPKGVVHTVGNFYYSALGSVEFFGLDQNDSWLVSLPLFHVGGMLIFIRTMLCGGTSLVHDNPGDLAPAVLQRRPTILSVVPAQLQRLLDDPKTRDALAACKAILLGGAPCPAPLVEKTLDAGIPVLPTYGSTEACAMVTAVRPGAQRQEHFTAGKVLPYRAVSLAHDGTVTIGGETLFKHYIVDGKPEHVLVDGKFRTADLGEWDGDGNLKITGRRDLVFISGGENINPAEIEKAMSETGLVLEAVVVPVEDDVFGQVPWAFALADKELDQDQIKKALKKILPSYKIPKKILPLTPGMGQKGVKRDRKALQKIAADTAKKA